MSAPDTKPISGWRKSMFPYSGRGDARCTRSRPRIVEAVASRALASARAAAVALPLFFAPRIHTLVNLVAPTGIADVHFISPAQSQPTALTKSQSDALSAYNRAVDDFKSILRERRAQIRANQRLPNLPGQVVYLARNNMISTYKDLTSVLPS